MLSFSSAAGTPGVHTLVGERHGDAEGAALPGCREDEFPIGAWQRGRAFHVPDSSVRLYAHPCASLTAVGVLASPTPIMASRVTNVTSSVSDQPSVPAGRSGSTR
jgi:hypothetical protein